jgi:hypothetical protein
MACYDVLIYACQALELLSSMAYYYVASNICQDPELLMASYEVASQYLPGPSVRVAVPRRRERPMLGCRVGRAIGVPRALGSHAAGG